MNNMPDHGCSLLLCGWKRDMADVLKSFIERNRSLHPENITVVANVDTAMLDSVREKDETLRNIVFYQGDCSDENTLKKAAVPSAPEIFVLADESKPDASVFDIDSRTINTVGTVLSLSRDARICVEIIDERFKPLLTDPRIDAVICTSEIARQVLSRSFITPGFSKIINHMIESQNGGQLRTVQFPREYVGRSFETLSSYFNESSGATLVGLVENAGKHRELKNEAVRDAQKTPSMTQAVKNLLNVKKLRVNKPNINPGADYIIPKNSLAVIIERSMPEPEEAANLNSEKDNDIDCTRLFI